MFKQTSILFSLFLAAAFPYCPSTVGVAGLRLTAVKVPVKGTQLTGDVREIFRMTPGVNDLPGDIEYGIKPAPQAEVTNKDSAAHGAEVTNHTSASVVEEVRSPAPKRSQAVSVSSVPPPVLSTKSTKAKGGRLSVVLGKRVVPKAKVDPNPSSAAGGLPAAGKNFRWISFSRPNISAGFVKWLCGVVVVTLCVLFIVFGSKIFGKNSIEDMDNDTTGSSTTITSYGTLSDSNTGVTEVNGKMYKN